MIRGADRPYTIVKHDWCDEARDGLRDTFYENGEFVAHGVMSGRMELFRVNDDSWAVTEIMRGMLFIWCYQGKGATQFIEKMRIVARANGFEQLSFFSKRKGAARAWRKYNPRILPTPDDAEKQYVFEVSTSEQ